MKYLKTYIQINEILNKSNFFNVKIDSVKDLENIIKILKENDPKHSPWFGQGIRTILNLKGAQLNGSRKKEFIKIFRSDLP